MLLGLLKSIHSDKSTLSFSNICNLYKYSSKKTCEEYLLSSWKIDLAAMF